jgi:glycerophosphoryl diester phosphodiesterase
MEIIAHRGASHDAPENTLAAARLAWAQGTDALECDVQLTRDGELAVFHDDDTRRLAPALPPGAIAERTLEEWCSVDVGAWKEARFRGERVPALRELLGLVPAGRRIFIELKNGPESVPALVRTLAGCPLAPAQVVVISFHYESARAAKRALPRCEVCWILERPAAAAGGAGDPSSEAAIARARAAQLDGLDLDADWPVDAALVDRVHAAGLKLYVWTVDDAERAHALAAAGVDGITTNRPGWLRERLETHG